MISPLKITIVRDYLQNIKPRLWSSCCPVDWDDTLFLRTCLIRLEHGDASAWRKLIAHVTATIDRQSDFAQFLRQKYPAAGERIKEISSLLDEYDNGWHPHRFETGAHQPTAKNKSRIMFVEGKHACALPGHIGRVQFSKTGRTAYYLGRTFWPTKRGYKYNYIEAGTRYAYWISGCHRDGCDTLYPDVVQIDANVRSEYWLTIRKRPDLVDQHSFRSPGRHSRK